MENTPAARETAKRWLRELREQRGYTQEQLAEVLGVDRRTILNMEADGKSFPNGFTMLRLLEELGVVVDAPPGEPNPIESRLVTLEARVAGLPTADDLRLGLQTVQAAIDRLAKSGTGGASTGRTRKPA